MRDIPTPTELQESWEDLRRIHAEHLEEHGVKLPQGIDYRSSGKSIQLSVLHYHSGQSVNKNLISQVCQRDAPHLAADQQVRHLKRDGWHLTGRGSHALDPYKVSSEFETDRIRRQGTLNASGFEDLKAVFDYKCASCGSEEGKTNPRYGDDIVELQRGHKDPDKPMTMDNIIPQCQFCNRAYRRDYVFDDKGRVSHIADVRPVRKASKTVQRKVWEWLKTKFSSLF